MRVAVLIVLTGLCFAITAAAQPKEKGIDAYLAKHNTIVIARCLEVGPVNILLQANVKIEILLVVKGNETLRTTNVQSQYGMEPGKRYLISSEGDTTAGGRPFARDRSRVVEVSESESIDELKRLSPRIIVLRTMNLRAYRLESKISSLKYELESLNAARQER